MSSSVEALHLRNFEEVWRKCGRVTFGQLHFHRIGNKYRNASRHFMRIGTAVVFFVFFFFFQERQRVRRNKNLGGEVSPRDRLVYKTLLQSVSKALVDQRVADEGPSLAEGCLQLAVAEKHTHI